MSRNREPIWNHCAAPAVRSDAVDAVVGPAWDLVVVGAGVVGLCAALAARESGRTVCVVDAGEEGLGVSGQATVKVTSGHGALAGDLAQRHGDEAAVAYQRANDQGYATLKGLVDRLPEDVGWSPTEHVAGWHRARGVRPLHAPGLPGAVEQLGAVLGLPLPRVAIRARRQRPPRPCVTTARPRSPRIRGRGHLTAAPRADAEVAGDSQGSVGLPPIRS